MSWIKKKENGIRKLHPSRHKIGRFCSYIGRWRFVGCFNCIWRDGVKYIEFYQRLYVCSETPTETVHSPANRGAIWTELYALCHGVSGLMMIYQLWYKSRWIFSIHERFTARKVTVLLLHNDFWVRTTD